MSSFASYPSLKDRAVFISGGGSGIGASIVEHFAAQGAKVGFVDIDEAASKALGAKIAAAGHPEPLFAMRRARHSAYQAAITGMAARLGPFTADQQRCARRSAFARGGDAGLLG
jgi:NAD(P)-dependent dehydrogenase (short-subunit alcohol dehydrogenase family)